MGEKRRFPVKLCSFVIEPDWFRLNRLPNTILKILEAKYLYLGAELVDSVLDVVRKEAESCDCLQVFTPCNILPH